MSTTARKARKRAGIKFEKAPKKRTRAYTTKREQQRARSRMRLLGFFNSYSIGGVL